MDLDDLKSAWKAVPEEKKYDQKAIFEMLKKKSSSTIKYLFIFTFIEFVLVLGFTISSLFKGKLLTGDTISFDNSPAFYNYAIGSGITILFSFLFLFLNYRTYKRINVNNSIHGLMKQIITFRRIVNIFIFFVLLALIVVSIPYYFELGKNIYITGVGPTFNQGKALLFGYLAVFIAMLFLIFITVIYYGLIYWFFLRKLSQNLKDLKEIN